MNGENGAIVERPPALGPVPRLGSVSLASRYILAPLAGYTNLAFRLAVRACGGLGLATTDLVNARALLQGSRKSFELIQTCPEDRPLAVQLYGSEPEYMAPAAQWLENYGVTAVDINMGCPVQKVVKGGGGSAMMCSSPAQTVALVRAVVEAVKVPVTVKMRLGWDAENLSAPFFAREFEQAGVAAVTIHGRTREQGFGGTVHLDGIRTVVEAVDRLPIFGNGDVRSIADAARMFRTTGCTGLAIGRGALLNPWFFAQLTSWEATGEPGPSPGYAERLDFMERHFHSQIGFKGERFGCLTFRKVANWHCKVLKPGREVQRRLMMVSSTSEFDGVVAELRERYLRDGPPPGWLADAAIAVPSGPVSHW